MAKGFHIRRSTGKRAGVNVHAVEVLEEHEDGDEEVIVTVTSGDPNEVDRVQEQLADLLARLIP
jgi:acetolactate synthase small subunit